jgi:hypothetical protein
VRPYYEQIDKVEAVDKYTLRIQMKGLLVLYLWPLLATSRVCQWLHPSHLKPTARTGSDIPLAQAPIP